MTLFIIGAYMYVAKVHLLMTYFEGGVLTYNNKFIIIIIIIIIIKRMKPNLMA